MSSPRIEVIAAGR